MSLYRGKRLMARNTRFTCGQTQVMELASTIRFPDHHETGRNGSFPFPDRELKICGGHGPGETPGPIPNPEAKAWHGDGTALDRVWESSTPPHHTYTRTPGRATRHRGSFAYQQQKPHDHPQQLYNRLPSCTTSRQSVAPQPTRSCITTRCRRSMPPIRV